MRNMIQKTTLARREKKQYNSGTRMKRNCRHLEGEARVTAYLILIPPGTNPGNMTARERVRNPESPWQRETAMDRAADFRIGKKKERISRGDETEMEIERRSQRRGMQKIQKKRKKRIYWMKSK
jgi:hypothetical protein